MIVAQNINKSFGKHQALTNFSIEIPEQSIYGLLGPNGAGKTTFLRILNQISVPDSGEILINNELLKKSDIQHIGYLPEERGLYKSMKVGEQILYLAQLKGLSKTEAKKRMFEWFEKLKIEDWSQKKIQDLSKGMAQKIQFIVTVIHQPKLLIFDEPFSGFDPVNAQIIKDQILALNRQGTTILFSTHRMESVEELCNHMALIHQSHKVLDGKVSEIKNSFKNNTFEVKLETENSELVLSSLQPRFELHQIKAFSNHLEFQMKAADNFSENDILRELIQLGKVQAFAERIPSVNEIFIQKVAGYAS
ncbi:ABC transporter ATP-binding protein [Mesonia sp. K7]|uniref:ABC transporter ATP-binding protein n=1 Tax=Mesonia sp. K7 TaxID=2218606 RepID=UPI001F203C4E|nr:ATP-binding cassette domain-containing protein [Mesonia sp. K7]